MNKSFYPILVVALCFNILFIGCSGNTTLPDYRPEEVFMHFNEALHNEMQNWKFKESRKYLSSKSRNAKNNDAMWGILSIIPSEAKITKIDIKELSAFLTAEGLNDEKTGKVIVDINFIRENNLWKIDNISSALTNK